MKRKILIIDDEISFTNMVKLVLESTGSYEVRTENNGKEGLSTALEFNPDLILLDIIMPDISGDEVFSKIKASNKLKYTPIVFLTAIVNDKEVKAKEGVIGGHSFLAKPVGKEKLIDCVEKNIRGGG